MVQAFKALIDLGRSQEQPGVNDRSGLIEDMQNRYGTSGDDATRTLGNVVAESATLLYSVFGEKGSEGIREFFQRPEIVELCNVPLDSPRFNEACNELATRENAHWAAQAQANPDAPGPAAGAAFSGSFRNYIQQGVATVVRMHDRGDNENLASTVAGLNAFSRQTTTTAADRTQGSNPPPAAPTNPAGRAL
ncbi:hypothetical protein G3I43_36915 [Streptomyces anulatus]|uniref:Uncharacterized protein n=1 Tax=Streptomyces anulatus TaxID=1892 RepID=A0A6G3T3K1_STRAQ|nr:hypothetical protein [Streptomyces anulatus]NEB89693.1 hypothetical protein [Streptomyces anulatus]